jgi:8-hydroxy-5-deazaflavin:NADPH oxidoreductase
MESSPEGLSKGLVMGHTTSAAELVATWAKGARVVKAFNTTGWQNMANPNYGLDKATMFLCGGDAEAKSVVATLGKYLGFDMIDAAFHNCTPTRTVSHALDTLGLFTGTRT